MYKREPERAHTYHTTVHEMPGEERQIHVGCEDTAERATWTAQCLLLTDSGTLSSVLPSFIASSSLAVTYT